MKPQTLSNKKYQWLKRIEVMEDMICRMISHSVRGDLSKSSLEFRNINRRLITLGECGERLAEQAVRMHRSDKCINHICDAVNTIELLTGQIKRMAEAKFRGAVLPEFPVFITNLPAASDLTGQSRAVAELVKLMEGSEE